MPMKSPYSAGLQFFVQSCAVVLVGWKIVFSSVGYGEPQIEKGMFYMSFGYSEKCCLIAVVFYIRQKTRWRNNQLSNVSVVKLKSLKIG